MTYQGLTEAEALHRRRSGQGNNIDLTPSRSYWQIVFYNVFTFVNMVLFVIGALLVILGSPTDAITTAGLVLMNVLVGLVQELRAKRKLDRIALLTRPKVTVIREGTEKQIDPSEVVLGDLIILNAGDQLVCDGQIVGENPIEVDESLLTGESDYVPKKTGDAVYSGSFCVTGSTIYETTKVGAESFANKITAKARDFKLVKTPLQRDVNTVVRVVAFVCVILGSLLHIDAVRVGLPVIERVQIAAVTMGMIPQGLIFLVTLSYALGAVRIVGKGALVQQINAIESMSNITVLCMDKTGTLTTNQIRVNALYPYHITMTDLSTLLGIYSSSPTSSNRTNDAIKALYAADPLPFCEEVPFASSRKWSGLTFDTETLRGTYILGAPEILEPYLKENAPELTAQREAWAAQGLRVVMFAHLPEPTALRNSDDKPEIPAQLIPLGLICLSDELRPDAHQVLENFSAAGIELKIISGDNPQTVAAIAAQAGFDISGGVVSGVDLAEMSDQEFAELARTAAIFGRITPDQKERLVAALKADGEYVAMMGDGVNDVLSLKKSDIGIAMQSGSAATRNVSDIVLLNDSFAVLPAIFQEGQRILNGIEDTMRLLLTRTVYVAVLIGALGLVNAPFPFLPTHDALNSFLSAGLPPILLAIWARPGKITPDRMGRVGRFIFPVALCTALLGFGLFLYIYDRTEDVDYARSAVTTAVILCGAILIWYVKPPAAFWAVCVPVSQDRRPAAVGAAVVLLYAIVMLVVPLREFFALVPLEAQDYALIAGAGVIWMIAVRFVLKLRLMERFVGLKA